jgi:hypothetical protein
MFQRIKRSWLTWKRNRWNRKTITESGGIPTTLAETYPALAKLLKEDGVAKVRAGTEDDMCQYHFGLGMWLRNNWSLWQGGPLASWFNKHGIHHADDMSGIIMTSFYRQLKGEPIKLEEQVKYYRDFWTKQGLDPDTVGKKV